MSSGFFHVIQCDEIANAENFQYAAGKRGVFLPQKSKVYFPS